MENNLNIGTVYNAITKDLKMSYKNYICSKKEENTERIKNERFSNSNKFL